MFAKRLGRSVLAATVGLAMLFEAPSATADRPFFTVPTGPRSGWRGRIYIRNGLLARVYRERWGNGITDNGLAFGTAAINGFVQTAPLFAGLGGSSPNNNDTRDSRFENNAGPIAPLDANGTQRKKKLDSIRQRQTKLLKEELGLSDQEIAPVVVPPQSDDQNPENLLPGI